MVYNLVAQMQVYLPMYINNVALTSSSSQTIVLP